MDTAPRRRELCVRVQLLDELCGPVLDLAGLRIPALVQVDASVRIFCGEDEPHAIVSMLLRGSHHLFIGAPRLCSVHSGQLSGVWADRNLGNFAVPFFIPPVDPLSQLFHEVLHSRWYFSKEKAAGCRPAAHASPSGADVREVSLFLRVPFDRLDLRYLRPGLTLGVLVGLYFDHAALAFDSLRSPANCRVDRSPVQALGPWCSATWRSIR